MPNFLYKKDGSFAAERITATLVGGSLTLIGGLLFAFKEIDPTAGYLTLVAGLGTLGSLALYECREYRTGLFYSQTGGSVEAGEGSSLLDPTNS